ncbi:hypothetical protein HK098_004842 [Nowakowskiella sp. JEL0407]|nr:hypothetical protein HK098_004842 [Nowakowskiella sp. JEL0407]
MLSLTFLFAAISTFFTGLDGNIYFGITAIMVVVSSVASALLMGFFATVPSSSLHLIQALSSGQGLAGMVPSIVQLILLLNHPPQSNNPKDDLADTDSTSQHSRIAFYHFSVTFIIGLLTFFGYIKRNANQHEGYTVVSDNADEDEIVSSSDSIPTRKATTVASTSVFAYFKFIFPFAFLVFLNFAITLSLFPGVTSLINSVDTKISWFFVSLHFLIYNLFDFAGKFLPILPIFKLTTPTSLTIATLSRLIFIPLFFQCNIQFGTSGELRGSLGDIGYLTLLAVFATTNGLLGTNILMQSGKLALDSLKKEPKNQRLVDSENVDDIEDVDQEIEDEQQIMTFFSNVMMFALAGGLAFGSLCAFLIVSYGL